MRDPPPTRRRAERDTPIECPRCGSTFTPAESRPAPAAGKAKAAGGKPAGGKRKKNKDDEPKTREFMNPVLLLAIIATGLIAYIAVAAATVHVLGKAGRVTDMMAYLPADCTVVRGANLKILGRYPGYKAEYDKYVTPEVAATLDALRTASGLEEEDAFTDYVLTGTNGSGAVHAIRCRDDFVPEQIGEGLNGTPVDVGGTPCYQLPATAPGLLAGAHIYMPTYRHVVVVRGGGNQLRASLAGFEDPDESFLAGLSDAGEKCMSGHTWVIVRSRILVSAIGTSVAEDKDLKRFAEATKTSNEMGAWNSFGGRVRFGAAIDCGSSSVASDLAGDLRESEYSKGDEAELSRPFKSAFPGSYNKEFLAYLSAMSFESDGTALVIVSSVGGEQGIRLLQIIDITKLGGTRP